MYLAAVLALARAVASALMIEGKGQAETTEETRETGQAPGASAPARG